MNEEKVRKIVNEEIEKVMQRLANERYFSNFTIGLLCIIMVILIVVTMIDLVVETSV